MRVLIFIYLGFCLNAVSAQSTSLPVPASGLKYLQSYKIDESTYHLVAPGTDFSTLSQIDLEWMRPYKISKAVEKKVYDNSHHSTSITILNPEEAYSDFPNPVGRIEINQDGTQVYDTTGTIYLNLPADSAYQADYNKKRDALSTASPGIMHEFPALPNASIIQKIQEAGGTVTMLPNSAWQISVNNIQTLYEPSSNRITTTKFEEQAVVETRMQQFVVTEQGIYAPSEDITRKPVIRPSGVCMEDVIRKKYSNYFVSISPDERTRPVDGFGYKTTVLWPNPAKDKLSVSIGESVQPGSDLEVYDLAGQKLFSQSGMQPGMEIEIPLNGWGNGVYFVKLVTQSGVQSIKFIKKTD